MDFDNWDEVRTAYQVARLGTVSGAADALGVHHATVIRHIDSLEDRLGVKLFQRHARGYTATEAGLDLLQVAQTTADQFAHLAGRLRGQGSAVTGELLVTSVSTLSELLIPVLADYQHEHPDLQVRYLTDTRVFRLEYGEAHVAIRAGNQPNEPDNIVQRLGDMCTGMFAHKSYAEKYGIPQTEAEYAQHNFVGPTEDNHRALFYRWMREHVPAQSVRFRVNDLRDAFGAVISGAGIGMVPIWQAVARNDLVQVLPPRDEWATKIWLVTHVDLHRTAKVQSFTAKLKESAKLWPTDCSSLPVASAL